MYASMHVLIYTYVCDMCIYGQTYTDVYPCISTYMYTYMNAKIHMYVCVHAYNMYV